MDLNIENYSFEDLLNLFSLSSNYTKADLKKAYKYVFKSHPDKSGLNEEYFIFLFSAVKILQEIYDIREKGESNAHQKEYILPEQDRKEIVDKVLDRFKTNEEFRDWFNTEFDLTFGTAEQRIEKEDGYGKWFKETTSYTDDLEPNLSKDQVIHQTKQLAKKNLDKMGLVVYQEPKSVHQDIESYGSKLQYDDLRRAHTETVIPVFEEDVYQHPSYRMNSVNEYKKHRDSQNCTPLSNQESKRILNERKEQEKSTSAYKAFEMLKKQEEMKQKQEQFWTRLERLAY